MDVCFECMCGSIISWFVFNFVEYIMLYYILEIRIILYWYLMILLDFLKYNMLKVILILRCR